MILRTLKNKWKVLFVIFAIVISVGFLWYSNELVTNISIEEHKKIELWAETTKELQEIPLTGEVPLFMFKILQENKTIPRILLDNSGKIINSMNLDSSKSNNENYLRNELEIMKSQHKPIVIVVDNIKNYIYYKDSDLLSKLNYYPYLQFFIIGLFLIVVFFAVTISQNIEQNKLWVGMSKETAHQLGTPISSLLAWIELTKSKKEKDPYVLELEKDVQRLEKITERFSRIGSKPVLTEANIPIVVNNALDYLRTRTSSRVIFVQNFSISDEIIAPINIALFEWVIENLWKNALDAMNNLGEIKIGIKQTGHYAFIDVTDTGKGIPKSKFKTVFKPGFTTKIRGWGLGLSLAKRIIETYHKGKIYVRHSEIDRGATFRIVLKKQLEK
ncbi:MAG: HAMP domain-containing histidine kinase [Bacteroidales bacterium]|nr:HAMP domain-containing histidine kinase [Bacteroidales bacterium]